MSRLRIVAILFCLASLPTSAQSYSAFNIQLVARLTPNTSDQGFDGRRYSGCWGWFQASKNKEYAISGTSNGTYFYDLSNPASPVMVGFQAGPLGSTYREIKTYLHYAYIISDDAQANGLQIVDMQYLPDSIHKVYEGKSYFSRAHSAWIDGSHLYLGSTTFSAGFSPMTVWSLATPTAPVLMRRLEQDYPFISVVHDMHSKHDTVYANCANQGLYIYKFDSIAGTFAQLGSYTGFAQAGYNHSSYLTADGKHLVFCEEIPAGLPIRIVDVQNPANVQQVSEVLPHKQTTPHNPFVKGNFALVSCYEDGLYVYDISDPTKPSRAGYFDTYPQSGANTGFYGAINYRGNWGNYPYLPSGLIIANDMQNGIFILNASAAYTTTDKDYVGIAELEQTRPFSIGPNPADSELFIHTTSVHANCTLRDALGKTISTYSLTHSTKLDISGLQPGLYDIEIDSEHSVEHKKITIQHPQL